MNPFSLTRSCHIRWADNIPSSFLLIKSLNGSHWLCLPGGCPEASIKIKSSANDPAVEMAGFEPSDCSDPGVTMAGFGCLRRNRSYRATVSRFTPSSRAMRRCDQSRSSNPMIAWMFAILSLFDMYTPLASCTRWYTSSPLKNGWF